ncbi:MAG: xylulokinase [Actinomycetota bacterium]
MSAYLIGTDIGTTSTKTVLINQNGKLISSATKDYPMDVPKAGWAEQNPKDWYDATIKTIRQVIEDSKINPTDIKAIGLSGQMHGSVFLDENNEVIRPAILWCDQRTGKQCQEIYDIFGFREFVRLSHNQALPGFTAPKILWLKENEPENYKKVTKILLPKDYVRYKLSGVFATEVSDAAGTILLDIAKRDWSREILGGLKIKPDLLPPVHESPEITSKVNKKAAKLTGLKEGTPIAGGGSDNAAGAVGSGIIREGLISDSIGTSGVVFATSNKPVYDPEGRIHAFCHAIPGKWHFTGVTLSAAGSLKWYYEAFGPSKEIANKYPDKKGYELLNKQAEKLKPGSEGLIFLPYLSGERTPHGDPYARGIFFGLSYVHGQDHFVRAVMEGVSFSQLDCLALIRAQNISSDKVVMFGGGAKSKIWRQILADILNTKIVTINIGEGPAYGAALIAGAGSGVFASIEEACDKTIKEVSENNPIAENVAKYKKIYPIYRSLYDDLKEEYKKLEEID